METSSSTEFENEKMGLKISIELMNRSLEKQGTGIDSMKATARTLLSASSVIVSLLGALQLLNVRPQTEYIVLFNWGVGITLFLYAAQMGLDILVLSPLKISGPIKEDWDLLYDTFTQKGEIEILREQLASYLDAIDSNQPVLKKVRWMTMVAGILLALVVLILMLLNFIPRQVIC